jgi:hypothetical protein
VREVDIAGRHLDVVRGAWTAEQAMPTYAAAVAAAAAAAVAATADHDSVRAQVEAAAVVARERGGWPVPMPMLVVVAEERARTSSRWSRTFGSRPARTGTGSGGRSSRSQLVLVLG